MSDYGPSRRALAREWGCEPEDLDDTFAGAMADLQDAFFDLACSIRDKFFPWL